MKKNNFTYFTGDGDHKEKRREIIKKTLKWIKIVFYIIIFGLALTGCVQSFVIKNSYNVGNGVEFYNNKDEVAPRVNTLKNKEIKTDYSIENSTEKSQEIIKINKLDVDSQANYLVTDENVLKSLKNQTVANGGDYGVQINYLTSFKFGKNINLDGWNSSPILERNGKYLFRSDNSKTYEYVSNAQQQDVYTLAYALDTTSGQENQTLPILLLQTRDVEKQQNGKTSIVKENIFTTNDSGQKVYNVVWIPGLQKVYTYSNNDNSPRNAFARDVLQMFYQYSFGPSSEIYQALGKDPSLFLKEKIDSISQDVRNNNTVDSNGANGVLFTLTEREYVAVIAYQKTLTEYLKELQYFNGENKDVIAKNGLLVSKYDYNTNLLKSQNVSKAPLSGDNPIRPITSWGEAWEYGPFFGIFVYPLAKLMQPLRRALPEWDGWASIICIILAVIVTRLINLAVTYKSVLFQGLQEDLKYKKAAIDAKYAGLENNKAMKVRKQQEIQALYAKSNVNPMDQFASVLLTLPIFLAMWRVIQSIPEIKQTTWLGLNFASTSYQQLFSGQFVYIWILIVTVLIQLASMYLPQYLNKKKHRKRISIAEEQALKKNEKTQKIVMLIMCVFTVILTAGVQVYWLFGGLWNIMQTLSVHKITRTKWFKEKIVPKVMKK
ncbi:membrane protein insertase YidC [Mycoplasma nasistruthionis]|uniref:Membrane protein insertase YidC n=1 Tax=Mycoplasma nasistruthionis TaxID=353852 RepID=A0A5B7XVI8_9MOLU|nr:membrane protein insertase YidC [Mycoplasma nasistruthionis]QCZ36878.1 membrane protein insertase YidC [Mycoplasma nasistruthionis]